MISDSQTTALERITRYVRTYEAAESSSPIDLDRVQRKLEKIFGTVERVPAREHVYSYSFAVYFDHAYKPIDPELKQKSRFTVIAWLSWIAPFATIQWRENVTPREAISIRGKELPAQLQEWSSKLERTLVGLGFDVLSEGILAEIVPGKSSELDDSPASVFEVLFSAID
jgi:hypothetical protein